MSLSIPRLLQIVCTLTVYIFCLLHPVHGKPKRNVFVIFADDAGFLQSAYNNSVCDTPNLDKLASRSVLFRRGYTSVSSCSPSRSVLLTGLPQHQNGMYGLEHSVHHFQSFNNVMSLPLILGQNGVRTGIIGKKHIAPDSVYKFEYDRTQDVNQVGRNITHMKTLVREFFNQKDDRPFFLYLAFFDTHRGGSFDKVNGPFMNKWGNGQPGMGSIPDWTPKEYKPQDVLVPYFLPDTPATRGDLAAMYTTFNRMDQGIGIFLDELKASGHVDDTLVMFTADNGIPFPNAKTNLYEPGMGEPMLISSPLHKEHWGKQSNALASTIDFTPTILEWFGVEYPRYTLNGARAQLTGRSLLPLAADPDSKGYNQVFSSHDFHEVTMPYPMRVVRNDRYRLIHNLNNRAPYPLATDLYSCPTFMDILNRTRTGRPTHWFKTLPQYYYRPEWELFDLQNDPQELTNLASDPGHTQVLKNMQTTLADWLVKTNDPWRCMPHGCLIDGKCWPMYNEFKEPGSDLTFQVVGA